MDRGQLSAVVVGRGCLRNPRIHACDPELPAIPASGVRKSCDSEESSAVRSRSPSISITTTTRKYTDGTLFKEVKKQISLSDNSLEAPAPEIKKTLTINNSDKWTLVLMIFFLLFFVTMAYGPIAAFLVEMFPTKIRYTSMSLPYHIGNGVFGGLMPAIATFLASQALEANKKAESVGEGMVYAKPYLQGLYYPIIIASVCFVIGLVFLKDKSHNLDEN